jgi:nitrate/nitrite-specific signal transduction histidine kinase
VLITSLLHRSNEFLAATIDSILLTEEAEIDLLLHDRETDPHVQRESAGRLLSHMTRVRQHVTTTEEARILDEAERSIAAYLQVVGKVDAADREVHLRRAFEALERLVAITGDQSNEVLQQASRWDDLANTLGTATTVLLLVVMAWSLWWMRSRVLKPLLGLAVTIERFARGDRGARATESGSAELRDIARRYNEMAMVLASQREDQIAFLGGVAHDLRGPLSALAMAISLIDDDGPPPAE